MAVDTFIAININCDNHKINSNDGIPIIFYWDGKSDMREDFKNDPSFIDKVYDGCFNRDAYDCSYLSLVYVDNNVKDHKFKVDKINIQDLFPFENIWGYLNVDFIYQYPNEILKDLYYKIYKEEYKTEYNINSLEYLKDIFSKIMEYEKSPSVDTILNYIITQLDDKTNLMSKNKQWLIRKTKELIEE